MYTRLIVNRLQNEEKVIKASEHWKDDKALVLPAQMFRYGSEVVAEKEGLKYIAENPGKNYYTMEKLGDKNYFTAVYADTAVAPACISCHNAHKDSPRSDFKLGEVMGGVVIRLPM